jgi:hypothetical protein
MAGRKGLLTSLLTTLITEWGAGAVRAELNRLDGQGYELSADNALARKKKLKARPTASEQVGRVTLPSEHLAIIADLAGRYDRKQFLPSVSDVREFLTMLGEQPHPMKDRSAAFKAVLECVSKLPLDRLNEVSRRAMHSGPAQLGPISDAISSAAETLPRYRDPKAS